MLTRTPAPLAVAWPGPIQERRKRYLRSDLEQLCDRGCLVAYTSDELEQRHARMARKIRGWQGHFDRAYAFESRILQRLIQGRIVSSELEEMRTAKRAAKAQCRWLHVKNHVINLAANRRCVGALSPRTRCANSP